MDILLGKVTQQAMNYAIRSGITITASFAVQQSARLLRNVGDVKEKDELRMLQERLGSKMQIISPAIDMIELISARGNTSLESAVALTKSLRLDIHEMGQKLQSVGNEAANRSTSAASKARSHAELKQVVAQMRSLLNRIDDAVPLINLAITTSGASLSTALPSTVSPSRLLQASTFLTAGDSQYSSEEFQSVQIGPTFTLSLYMLFSSNVRPQSEEEVRHATWKEVIRKARVKLVRGPINTIYGAPQSGIGVRHSGSNVKGSVSESDTRYSNVAGEVQSDEFAYQLLVVEDCDDGLVHDLEDNGQVPTPFDDVSEAGIIEPIPIHEISKIFYADTGKILNIGSDDETNNPILLLKRDLDAIPPRRMAERWTEDAESEIHPLAEHLTNGPDENPPDECQAEIDAQFARERTESPSRIETASLTSKDRKRIPHDLDPEWLAFEVYEESPGSETPSETDALSPRPLPPREVSLDPELANGLSQLHLHSSDRQLITIKSHSHRSPGPTGVPTIRTSLSLLEMLLRLLSLQQFQQASHLAIADELLSFFLSESATTGAATGDEAARRRLRQEARLRVGFDPYDESPIKRRGEEYQYRGGRSQAGGWGADGAEGWDGGSGAEPWPEPEDGDSELPRSPLRLKDRASPSRSGSTSVRSSPPVRSSPGGPRWSGGHSGMRSSRTPSSLAAGPSRVGGRVSSPLARVGAGLRAEEASVQTPEKQKQEEEQTHD